MQIDRETDTAIGTIWSQSSIDIKVLSKKAT